jgi:hypothetical protein
VDLDAEHRALVSIVQILRARATTSYRLVISADAPFPAGASEHEWRFTRAREASDVNAEVRDAVNQTGYSLFQIGLSLSEIPKS